MRRPLYSEGGHGSGADSGFEMARLGWGYIPKPFDVDILRVQTSAWLFGVVVLRTTALVVEAAAMVHCLKSGHPRLSRDAAGRLPHLSAISGENLPVPST